ncbi:ATP-binding protein [Ferruginibacter sp.]|nr:ATP-binding protein [Ferruginibacter sp.]
MQNNQQSLINALKLLQQVIYNRLQVHFKKEEKELSAIFPSVKVEEDGTALNDFIIKQQLTVEEYITLLIALVPHVQPAFFENIIQEFLPQGGDFAEFGAVKASNQRSILPTGETVLFILAGNDMQRRLQLQQLFNPDHFFYKQNILWLEHVKDGEPVMSGKLLLGTEWVDRFLFNKETAPKFSPEFPAKQLTSKMKWDDLILTPQTKEEIDHIKIWLSHNDSLLRDNNLSRKIKPGYRALFYGPPGTGKTLTVSLLGKEFNKEVYRVDLSQVVSKYIGETEKNLEKVFSKAENKDWILFFDEADALFGKRTNVSSSHDRFANQEVSYLLQRVEDFPGLLILASNFKSNLDKAFTRRFHAMVHFPMPNATERLLIWQKSQPQNLELAGDINLNEIAQRYELSGASILNIMQFAALKALHRNDSSIQNNDLLTGIRREFWKEEKTI